jgi:hypothetical protein
METRVRGARRTSQGHAVRSAPACHPRLNLQQSDLDHMPRSAEPAYSILYRFKTPFMALSWGFPGLIRRLGSTR